MALIGSTTVIVVPALTGSASVSIACPSGTLTPYPPTILSVSQVTSGASALLAFGVAQSPVTGMFPVTHLKLYRSLTRDGPFTTVVDFELVSKVVVVNQLFDLTPDYGSGIYYAATAVDSAGTESGLSNVVMYAASALSPSLGFGRLSPGAFGPYPLLGSDVYLDPTTREAVVGPNGDLLTVNGLECLAQDLRIRILSEYGELPMHPTFGLTKGKVIGSGQATRAAQAIVLVANIKDMLRREPRVYQTLSVTIEQYDAYSWIISYTVMAIGVEDPAHLSLVYNYY